MPVKMEGEVSVLPPCFEQQGWEIQTTLMYFSVAFGSFIFIDGFVSFSCSF